MVPNCEKKPLPKGSEQGTNFLSLEIARILNADGTVSGAKVTDMVNQVDCGLLSVWVPATKMKPKAIYTGLPGNTCLENIVEAGSSQKGSARRQNVEELK